MKRIASLLIALVLLVSCTAALAEDFGVSIQDYLTVADMLNAGAGLEVEWTDRSEDLGYTGYQGIVTSLSNNNSIWVYNDPILAVEAVYEMTLDDNSEAYGNEFGQMAASAVISVWMAQHIADEDLQSQLLAMQSKLTEELTALISPLYTLNEDNLNNGVRNEGTFCGIPAVFIMEGSAEAKSCTLYIMVSNDAEVLANYN